jgi:Tn3 transposase DDE domain
LLLKPINRARRAARVCLGDDLARNVGLDFETTSSALAILDQGAAPHRAVEHRLSGTGDPSDHGQSVDGNLLQHVSPLGWEHINLTGDYVWRQDRRVERGKFRPLRAFTSP